jgi:hypothetical protein
MIVPELELPIALLGNGTENQPGKAVRAFFNPTEIVAYHDGYYPETGIFIYLKNGQNFQVCMTLDEYRELIQSYWGEVLKSQQEDQVKQNIKQKLKIIN